MNGHNKANMYLSCIRRCGRDTLQESGVCPECQNKEKKASPPKESQHPPRRFLDPEELKLNESAWAWPARADETDVEYLSLSEHTALLRQARAVAERYHEFIMGKAARQYGIDAKFVSIWDAEWKAAEARKEKA